MIKGRTVFLTAVALVNGFNNGRYFHSVRENPYNDLIFPVFSGEYQAGTDAVILACKYGKTKLITAKIISLFLFGVIVFTLHVIIVYGLLFVAFGMDGWNLSLQIAGATIPYPFTFLQAVLINFGVIYLILFAMAGLPDNYKKI